MGMGRVRENKKRCGAKCQKDRTIPRNFFVAHTTGARTAPGKLPAGETPPGLSAEPDLVP